MISSITIKLFFWLDQWLVIILFGGTTSKHNNKSLSRDNTLKLFVFRHSWLKTIIIFHIVFDEDRLYIKIVDLYVFDNFVADYSLYSVL
jgi:hypothetical protein